MLCHALVGLASAMPLVVGLGSAVTCFTSATQEKIWLQKITDSACRKEPPEVAPWLLLLLVVIFSHISDP